MNLDELKAAPSSDATKRADEMQKEIQALDTEIEALYRDDLERETRSWHGALKQRKEEIRKAEEAFRRTMNLCHEANREKKCMFCLDKDECEAYKREGKSSYAETGFSL